MTIKLGIIFFIIFFIIFSVIFYLYKNYKNYFRYPKNIIENINMIENIDYNINKNSKYNVDSYNYMKHYPILYINLDRSKDRDEYMKKQLKIFNIKGKRIKAIDGKKIIDKSSGKIDNEKYINDYVNLKANEIACTLSHIKAIREAYKLNSKYVYIVEDDCMFKLLPFWEFDIDYIVSKAPKDWGILQLHTQTLYCERIGSNMLREGKLFDKVEPNNYCWSAAIYLINRKGMKDILDICGYSGTYKMLRDKRVLLGVADDYIYAVTNSYYITKPIFFTGNFYFETTIQNSTDKYEHMRISNNIIDIYKETNGYIINKIINYDMKYIESIYKFDKFMKGKQLLYFIMGDTALQIYRDNEIKSTKNLYFGIKYENLNNNVYDIKMEYNNMNIKKYMNKIIYIEINHKNINIKLYVLYDNYYYINNNDKKIISSTDTINIYYNNMVMSILSDTKEYLKLEFGKYWYIPYNVEVDKSKVYEIYPRMIKEIKKPILWCYKNKRMDLIIKNCSDSFHIIELNDDLFKLICRETNISNDYIKYSVIDRYGGVFVDKNCIVINNIDFMIEYIKEYRYVTYGDNSSDKIINIMIGGKANNRITNKLLDKYNQYSDYDIANYIKNVRFLYMNEIIILDKKRIQYEEKSINNELYDIAYKE